MRKLTDEQETEICELYLSGIGCTTLGTRFSVTHVTILNTLQRHGIKRGSTGRRKHSINQRFFSSISDERSAYWLGFLAADGYISGHRLSIDLGAKDKAHLLKFLDHTSASYPIYEYLTSKGFPYAKVLVTSKTMTDDLAVYGIAQRKSAVRPWPSSLGPTLLRHFVRGYFDGDGGFSLYQGRYNAAPTPSFHIIAYRDFALRLLEFIATECGLRMTKPIPYGDDLLSVRYCGRGNTKAFCTWLYRDATVFMDRKHDLILPHLDHDRVLPSNTKLTVEMIEAIRSRLNSGETAWHIYASGDFPVGYSAIYKVRNQTTKVGTLT